MKEEKQQFNVYLTPGLIKRMKHHSVDEQLSLSDLVEKVFDAYLSQSPTQIEGQPQAQQLIEPQAEQAQQTNTLMLQPMVHVGNMEKALDFYRKLGATVLNGSRDSDWALLRVGDTELGLLAHPANEEQNEGRVELNFEYSGSLKDFEEKLREAGVMIARPTGDEGFGEQLQLEDNDGMLVKINQIDPNLYQ
jgi:catechol 2,3-dioxygenase-like lactoylglutathione lyase family enzyme